MGKDLFADLITDIEERYLKYNDEATLKEFAEFLEKEIEYLKTSSYNRQWAKRVFLIYEKLDKDPKLLRAVKNSFELKGFLFIAEAVIEVEDEMDDEEEKRNQLEDTAKQIDDKIQYLVENVSCEESWICQVDEIDEFVKNAGDEVKVLCKNLDRIQEIKRNKQLVLEVLKKDNEVLTFSLDRKWDKNYAKLVLAFVNTISNRVKDLMKNASFVDELYQKAQIVLSCSDDESIF